MIARKYNPGFLTDDEMVASFCVRTTEFELLAEVLRECTGSSNPHQIVIGPRGSGKTSLLLRVAAEVRRDAALSSRFFPVVFAEESYEVATAGEFWLECLAHVAAQAPRQEGDPDLHGTVGELRAIRDDRMLADRCLGALLDFADRQGKRLVLLVENLNMLFRDMTDSDAGWRLRKVLQTEPRLVVFASATSRFDEIDHPDHALYDLFRVRTLHPLDTIQCTVLWESVSGRRPAPETVRSLEILTGGSPRLISIVARFGAGLSFRALMADLLDLVDDHTEYFKSHLEALPAQERRVYLALAALWKPATTREIAHHARLETSKCSAQLARLGERGVVEVTGGSARRKQYYLTERLYNIYYLLRHRHGPDPLVEAVIRFMESYYSPPELKDVGARMAREMDGLDAEAQVMQRAALIRLIDLPAVAGYRDELLAMMPEGITAESDERAAREFFETTIGLNETANAEDTLAACNEVVRRFGAHELPAVLQWVAKALVHKASALGRLQRPDDVLSVCDDVLRRFGGSEAPALVEAVATALLNKGVALGELNREREALAVYDDALRRFGGEKTSASRALAARVLVFKGVTLGQLDRLTDALAAWNEVLDNFEATEAPVILTLVVEAMVNKATALGRLNRLDEALSTCDELVLRFGENEMPVVRERVAMSFVTRGAALGKSNRLEEAIAACDEVVRRIGTSENPVHLERVARALLNKAVALSELKRSLEALAVCDELVQRFGADASPPLRLLTQRTFLKKAEIELACRRYDAVDSSVELVLDRCGAGSPDNRLLGHLIRAKACFARSDMTRCEQDIEAIITILPELGALRKSHLDELILFSGRIGAARMRDLIWRSSAATLLLPLTTALEFELGLDPQVAREVEEVARDIRRDLARLKEGSRSTLGGEAKRSAAVRPEQGDV